MENDSRLQIKLQLKDLASARINDRITDIASAISSVQSSANEETKSSMGDKYETGKAMAQLEVERLTQQLAELKAQSLQLARIEVNRVCTEVSVGTIVKTNGATFFVSIALGQIDMDGVSYLLVSPVSPIAKQLIGKAVGHNFLFNKMRHVVVEVF